MIERRRFVRLHDSLKISYKIIGQTDIVSEQFTDNISGVGISFPLRHRMDPGSIVELTIQIPGHPKLISAVGEVIWLNHRQEAVFPFVVGIRFSKVSEDEQEELKGYVQSCLTAKGSPDIEWIG